MQVLTYDDLNNSKKNLPSLQYHKKTKYVLVSCHLNKMKNTNMCTCQYYDDAGNDVDHFLINSMLPEELLRNLGGWT